MKRVTMIGLMLLMIQSIVAQQINLNGHVSIHNSKYKTGSVQNISDAYVTADFATPSSSDVKGQFSMDFIGIGEGTSVALTIEKAGLEVVNRRDLLDVIVGRKTPIKIFLSPKGELAQAQAQLLEINMASLTKKHNALIARLQKNNEESQKVLSELEQKFGKALNDRFEAELVLKQKFGELRKQLPRYALELARQNLDYASESYIKAFEHFKNGDLDKTLAVLDTLKLEADYKKARADITKGESLSQTGVQLIKQGKLQIDQSIESFELIGKSHMLRFEYEKAIKMFSKVARMYKENDLSPIKLAGIYDKLAEAHYHGGNFMNANEYQSQAIVIKERFLKEDDPNLAISYDFNGSILMDLERFDEALEFSIKGLKIRQKVFEPDNTVLATSYNNLSQLYRLTGNYENSLVHVEKAIAIWTKLNSPELINGYNKKALLLNDLGRLEESMSYNKLWVEAYEKEWGEDHYLTAQSYNNLADNLRNLKRPEEALSYEEKALTILENTLEPNHPFIGILHNNMADTQIQLKNYNLATDHIEKAIDIFIDKLGPEHSNVASAYGKLVMISYGLGDFDKAVTYQRNLIDIRQKIFKPDHLQLADAYYAMGIVLFASGDTENALDYHYKGIAIMKKTDPQYRRLSNSYFKVSEIHRAQENFAKATDYAIKGSEINEAHLPPGHPYLAEDYILVSKLYFVLGKNSRAKEYRDKVNETISLMDAENQVAYADKLKTLDLELSKAKQKE